MSPALAGEFFTTEPPGKPCIYLSGCVQVGQVTPALKGLPVSWEELGLQEAGPAGF